MKYSFGLLALASLALAKEIPRDPIRHKLLYESGLMHQRVLNDKLESWAEHDVEVAQAAASARQGRIAAAAIDPFPEQPFAQCRDGKAIPIRDQPTKFYRCKNVNLHHFISHWKLGTQTPNLASSAWGWVSDTGREFALIAQGDGVAFAEITTAGKLRYLGRLPQTAGTPPSRWREIRTYKHYLIVASETFDHHVQIFDLKKLLPLDYRKGPVTFDPTTDLTGFFGHLPDGRAHNILSNDETGYVYVVGARPRTSECAGGLIFLNVTDPTNPTQVGCAGEDGYVHDAQCLIYHGPDKRYEGREICYGYNEDALTIYDVTDKQWPELVSVTSYEGATYTHQGWVLDKNNQEFLVLDDEIDEIDGRNPGTPGRAVTYIFDIRDLQKPKQSGYYQSPRTGNDHNQYVIGNYSYQSNYGDGISILDISSIPSNPTGSGVTEFGWFDVHPDNDNTTTGGSLGYFGTWGSYADYPSGFILVNHMEKGAFVLKIQNPK